MFLLQIEDIALKLKFNVKLFIIRFTYSFKTLNAQFSRNNFILIEVMLSTLISIFCFVFLYCCQSFILSALSALWSQIRLTKTRQHLCTFSGSIIVSSSEWGATTIHSENEYPFRAWSIDPGDVLIFLLYVGKITYPIKLQIGDGYLD